LVNIPANHCKLHGGTDIAGRVVRVLLEKSPGVPPCIGEGKGRFGQNPWGRGNSTECEASVEDLRSTKATGKKWFQRRESLLKLQFNPRGPVPQTDKVWGGG